MALLGNDDDDSYDLYPVTPRSSTSDPLFDSGEDFQIHKPKDKKEKRYKLEEKKGSVRSLPWAKQKEGTSDKNQKKGKHHHSKSGSRTPPDSPKSSRSEESRKLSRASTSGQLQPSPNIKSHRKRYSQLDPSDEEQSDDETTGFLVANKQVLDHKESQQTNPWATADDNTDDTQKSQTQFSNIFQNSSDNQDTNQDPWWPAQSSPPAKTTLQFPTLFNTKQKAHSDNSIQATSPDIPFVALEGQAAGVSNVINPMFSHIAGSPVREPLLQPMFFQSPYQPVTALPPPPQPLAPASQPLVPPPQPLAPPPSQTSLVTKPTTQIQEPVKDSAVPIPITMSEPDWTMSEPDWTISDKLREKCLSQFTDLKPSRGLLLGDKAREFFLLSKLPNQELSAIWRLADIDKNNALSEYEFCVAMKLVMMRRKGYEIPTSLPKVLIPRVVSPSFSDNFWPTTDSQTSTQSAPPPGKDQSYEEGAEGGVSTPNEEESESILLADIGLVTNPIDNDLVEMESSRNSNTGLLVDISDESAPPNRPHAVARLISLDDSEPTDSTALFVKTHRKTGSEGSIKDKDISREKPVRPAPPIPKIQRSKTVRVIGTSNAYAEDVKSSGVITPPPDLKSSGKLESLVISLDKGVPRRGSKITGISKGDYSTLESSPETSPTILDTPEISVESNVKKGFVRKQSNEGQVKQSALALEAGNKGHNRGKSLDLNKMIEADMTTDVLEDLPSAVPPKPPPKPSQLHVGKERESQPLEGTNQNGNEEQGGKKSMRVRSLSTGSMNKPTSPDDPHEVELETNALLLVDQPKPKSRKLKVAPRRPPPPIKPTLSDLMSYQVPETQVSTPSDEKLTIPKDKKRLQSSIRSLKDHNAVLTEVNKNLEVMLFKLMEERVKLEQEFDATLQQ